MKNSVITGQISSEVQFFVRFASHSELSFHLLFVQNNFVGALSMSLTAAII